MILVNLAVAEYLAGRWQEAARAAEEAHEVALQTAQRPQQAWALSLQALVRASLGREAEARADAAEALALAGERGMAVARIHAVWALGLLELSLDRPEEAARVLAPQRERLLAAGVGEPGTIRFVPDEIEALIALGRLDEAEELLGWLEERGRALDRASALAAAARCRGLLALARRDDGRGARLLRGGARRARRASASRSSGRGRCSRRESRCATPGAERDARAVIDEARGAFATLGALLWEAKAAAELDRIGGRRAARRRADARRGARGRARLGGPHEQGSRGRPLPHGEDGRVPPHARLPQARSALARRARAPTRRVARSNTGGFRVSGRRAGFLPWRVMSAKGDGDETSSAGCHARLRAGGRGSSPGAAGSSRRIVVIQFEKDLIRSGRAGRRRWSPVDVSATIAPVEDGFEDGPPIHYTSVETLLRPRRDPSRSASSACSTSTACRTRPS